MNKTKIMKKPNIPKSVLTFFISLLFCFGFDFGFIEMLKPKIRLPAKIYTYVLIVVSFFIYTFPLRYDVPLFDLHVLYLIHFIGQALVLIFCKSYTVCNFFFDVSAIGKNTAKSVMNFAYGCIIVFYGIATCKTVVCIGNCAVSGECAFKTISDYGDYVYCIVNCGLDVMPVVQVSIFYSLYTLLKSLKKSLEHVTFESDVAKILKYYMDIADCYDKIRPFYDFTVTVELIISVPNIMTLLWHMLSFIKMESNWILILTLNLMLLYQILHIGLPTIMVELTKSQEDGIVLLLQEKLANEDEKCSASLQRLLRYVKARPLHHYLWRCVPIDFRMSLSLISLCTTYFIVILQFSHLYDD